MNISYNVIFQLNTDSEIYSLSSHAHVYLWKPDH